MAEVRLRLGSGAVSLWMTTPHRLPGLVCSEKLPEVPAAARAFHGYGIFPCMNVSRSYRSSSAEEIPLYRSKSAYYDILQVSPTATHAQIKTAYYKQSFIYHPDKSAGSDHAAQSFSQVSEAYSVLGNRVLRKRYDAGILGEADVRGSGGPTATRETTSRSPSDGARSRRSPEVGARAQNIFDFDSFYRAHYGEQLQRQKHIRARMQEIQRQREETFQNRRLGRVSDLAIGLMLAVAATIMFSLKATKG